MVFLCHSLLSSFTTWVYLTEAYNVVNIFCYPYFSHMLLIYYRGSLIHMVIFPNIIYCCFPTQCDFSNVTLKTEPWGAPLAFHCQSVNWLGPVWRISYSFSLVRLTNRHRQKCNQNTLELRVSIYCSSWAQHKEVRHQQHATLHSSSSTLISRSLPSDLLMLHKAHCCHSCLETWIPVTRKDQN